MGVILTPRFLPNFRMSLDYTRIDKTNEFMFPVLQYVINNEDLLPGRIVRGPTRSQDPAGWAGPITSIDVSILNLATTAVQAYDLQADYSLATASRGKLHFRIMATMQSEYKNQLVSTVLPVDSVGFVDGPLKWRGNAGIDWSTGGWSLGWNAQYYHSQLIYHSSSDSASIADAVLNQGSASVPSQLYHDLIATYRFNDSGAFGGLLEGSEVSLGIQNILDESPPILAQTGIGVGYSFYGDPRLRRYTLSIRKQFGH